MKKPTHIARQAQRLKRGEINRRRFIMSAVATGVTLPTATSLAHQAQAAHPKAGGVLRLGMGDPRRMADVRAMALGNTLVEIAPDGALIGDLAAAFAPDDRGQRWIFSLREDATFQDGSPLQAAHVIASLSRADTPGMRGQIETLRADGDHTVVIDLIQPNPDFAWVLSDPRLTIRTQDGVGTGAYMPTQTARRLHKMDGHWKAGRNHFEALELVPMPNPADRLNALLNGDLDLIDDVDPRMSALLGRAPDIALTETEGASLYGLIRAPHTDAEIGRALSDATDRRDLAQKILLGHGQPHGGPVSHTRRPQKAAAISLGHDAHRFPGASDMVSLIARMAEKQGIAASTEPAEAPHFQAERLTVRPTVDWTLAEAMARRPERELGDLLNKARRATSADERTQHQTDALLRLSDQGDVFPLKANDIHAHKTALAFADGAFEVLRISERGWFA